MPMRDRRARASTRQFGQWHVDGHEADGGWPAIVGKMVCRALHGAQRGQSKIRSRRQKPAQAQLDQQHQHVGLVSIRRQKQSLPAWNSVLVFRMRRLNPRWEPATLRSGAGFAGTSRKRHRPRSMIGPVL